MKAAAGWGPDELARAGRENLDVDHVGRYDAKEDDSAAAEVERVRRWGVGPDAVVVDFGAGPGQFTLAAAPHVAGVIAVDVSLGAPLATRT
jgi:predicted methyltransferase